MAICKSSIDADPATRCEPRDDSRASAAGFAAFLDLLLGKPAMSKSSAALRSRTRAVSAARRSSSKTASSGSVPCTRRRDGLGQGGHVGLERSTHPVDLSIRSCSGR